MVALSAARETVHGDLPRLLRGQQGTAAHWKGGMLMINATGYYVPAADAAGSRGVVGVAAESYPAQATEGQQVVEPLIGLFDFNATSITKAMEGRVMYVVDDNTFDDSPGTNGVVAGILYRYISATRGILLIDGRPRGAAILTADADATYGAPEAALLNEIKALLNNTR